MALRNIIGESAPNHGAGHVVSMPDGCTVAEFQSLVISSRGLADDDTDTKLLLHLDGDVSNAKHPVTYNSSPVMDDSTYALVGVSGSGSILFDGTNWLTIDESRHGYWDSKRDFTVEFWYKRSAVSNAVEYLTGQSNAAGDIKTFELKFLNSNNICGYVYSYDQTAHQVVGAVIDDTDWHHVALVRNGNILEIFCDGISEDTHSLAGVDANNSSIELRIGRTGDYESDYFVGNIDEYRYSNTARYTTNFSVQTKPFASDEYTRFLNHLDANSASSLHAVTAHGSVQTWEEDSDTGDMAEFSGAMRFNGTDYISTPDSDDWNMGAGDFTIDFWFARDGWPDNYERILGQANSGNLNTSKSFEFEFTNLHDIRATLFESDGTDHQCMGPVIEDNDWHHAAFVRYGNGLKLYIDGAGGNTTDVTGITMNDSTRILSIGRSGAHDDLYYQGDIDELRITKGVARWTSDFTPSTAAYGHADSDVKISITDGDRERWVTWLRNGFADFAQYDQIGEILIQGSPLRIRSSAGGGQVQIDVSAIVGCR